MRNYLLIIVLLASGCATAKGIGRTINDAGSILRNLFAVDATTEQLQGMSAADWCAVHENVKPFIDEALAAKQAVAMQLQQPADAGVQ